MMQTHTIPLSRPAPGAPWLASSAAGMASPCQSCSTRRVCLAAQLCGASAESAAPVRTRKVAAGEALYRAGDPFQNLYVPRAGSCKSQRLHRDGRQQIVGFHLAGEVMGLDGIAADHHEIEAVALEDGVVCVLPYREVEAQTDTAVRRSLNRLLSREIVRESELLMLTSHLAAEERLAAFLADLAERYAARGYSATSLTLHMSRQEIGLYLGLTLETVSRALSRLQKRGLIDRQHRQIRILDLEALKRL